MIAVVTFYRRISQLVYYCKYSEVNDVVEAMVIAVFIEIYYRITFT